jgi:hypothetical protein
MVRISAKHLVGTMLPLVWSSHAQTPPDISATFGTPVTFATYAELFSYGFQWGPSDGQFGAIPQSNGTYTFYGTAGSSPKCAGSPSVNGTFSFYRNARSRFR